MQSFTSVLKSSWPLIVLLGLAALAGGTICVGYKTQPSCEDTVSKLHEDKDGPHPTHQSNSVTCERNCQVSFGLMQNTEIVEDEESNERNTECETIAEFELVAQRQIAHWAGISAFLAMLGVAGLLWTLWETRRSGQAQVRAYLSVSEIELSMGVEFFFLRVIISNCGQSPAKEVRFDIVDEFFIRETMGYQTTDLEPVSCGGDNIDVRPIPAQGEAPITTSTIEMHEEVRKQFDGFYGIDIEVYGTVYWEDVFGKRDKQEFIFSLVGVTIHDLREVHENGDVTWKVIKMVPGELTRDQMPHISAQRR